MSDDNKRAQQQQDEQRQRAQQEQAQRAQEDNPEQHSVTTDNRRGRENTSVPEHTRERPPPTEPAPYGANPKPPLKILNLDAGGDADWLDFSESAPMELLTAIYDNSKDGPVTIWSKRLVEANFAPQLWNWLLDADNAWRSRTLAMQLWEPPTEVPPKGESMQEVSFSMPKRQRQAAGQQAAGRKPA